MCFLSSPVQLFTLATVTDKNSGYLLISSGASFGRQALTVITSLSPNVTTSTGRRLESGTSSLLLVTEVRLPGRVLALRAAMSAPVGRYRSVMYCPSAGCHQSSHGPVAAGDRAGGNSSYVHGSTAAQAAPKQAPFMAIAPGAVGVYWVAVSQRGGAVDLLGSEPTRAARLLRGFACHGCSVRRVRRCATA